MKTNVRFAYLVGLAMLCLTISSQAQNTLSGPLTVFGSILFNGDAKVFGGKLGIDPTSNGFTVMEAIHLRDGNLRIDNGKIMAFDELTFQPDIDNSGDDEVRFLNSTGEMNLFIGREGNIGLGLSNPTAKLDVAGTARVRNIPIGSGDIVVADANGNLFRSKMLDNDSDETINVLQKENEALKARLDQLEQIVNSLASGEISTSSTTLTNATLEQNAPNPFSESTSVRYFIPDTVQDATLHIMDVNGNALKTITIEERGQGQLDLQANALSAGTYSYSLILDGQIMATKRMILTY